METCSVTVRFFVVETVKFKIGTFVKTWNLREVGEEDSLLSASFTQLH